MNFNALNEFLKKDLYQILNVSETASREEIEQAYQNLGKKYHPNSVEFQEITYAYDILIKNRKKYDNFKTKMQHSSESPKRETTKKTVEQKVLSSPETAISNPQNTVSKSDLLNELKKIECFITIIDGEIEPLKRLIQTVNTKFESRGKDLLFQENCKINMLIIEQNRVLQQINPFFRKFNKRKIKAICEKYDRQIQMIREYYRMQNEALEKELQEEKSNFENVSNQKKINLYQSYRKFFEQKRDQINGQLYGTFHSEFDKNNQKVV